MDIAVARACLGERAIIGVSCYDSLERAQTLAREGADYLAFGAFFPSPTKPTARHATPGLLRAAKPLGLPLVAIGGITPDNAPGLIAAGADFVAAISGVALNCPNAPPLRNGCTCTSRTKFATSTVLRGAVTGWLGKPCPGSTIHSCADKGVGLGS